MQKKRRFVRNVFASLLATLTAFSPALSVIPVYADEEDDGIKVQKSDDGIQVSNSDKKTVAIDIDGVNGELVLDAGKKDEQTVRVSDAKDKNGKLIYDEFNIDPHTFSAIWYALDTFNVPNIKERNTKAGVKI